MGTHGWHCLGLGKGHRSSLEGATKGQPSKLSLYPQPHQLRRQQWHRMGVGLVPSQHPSVPQADLGPAVSPLPPVAKGRLWLSALALGDVPTRCPRSQLSVGQSRAVHQWGWFAPAAQTSRV